MDSTTLNTIQVETSEQIYTIEYYDPLSDDLIRILQLYLIIPLHSAIAAAGIVTNFFTMIILWKIGIKSGMNVGTMALSCTDFLATYIQFAQCVCYILEYANPYWSIDMWSLGVIMLGWVRYATFFIAMWITAMISVERCLCVVVPFRVRSIFTKQRCLLFIFALYTLYSILLVIVYTSEEYVWDLKIIFGLNNSFTEIRILTVVITDYAAKVESVVDAISSISLSLLAQLLLIVSTVWMALALRASSEVRQSTTKGSDKRSSVYALKSSPRLSQNTTEDSQKGTFKIKLLFVKSSMLSNRERKLIKVAICLAVVLTLCNIPRYTILAVHYTLPGMKEGILKNLYGFLWDISDFSGTINCSSNFIVYWLLNKKFRLHFKNLFNANSD